MNRRLPWAVLMGAILLAIGVLSAAQESGEMVIGEDDVTVIPIDKLNVSQQALVSEAGIALLQAVADARTDLRRKEFIRARREVNKAYGLIRAVRNTSPALRIGDHISAMHKRVDESGTLAADDLLPIYAELDDYKRITGAAVVERSKAYLVDASKHIEAADFTAGMAVLTEVQETLVYLEIDLPIEETYQHVRHARALLRHHRGPGMQQRITPDDIAADEHLRATGAHLSKFAATVALPVREDLKVISAEAILAED